MIIKKYILTISVIITVTLFSSCNSIILNKQTSLPSINESLPTNSLTSINPIQSIPSESKNKQEIQESQPASITDSEKVFSTGEDIKDIRNLFKQNKKVILSKYGNGYTKVNLGDSEVAINGYKYNNGLTFVFDDETEELIQIIPEKGILILRDIKEGMSFQQIEEILGNAEIYCASKADSIYVLEYKMGGYSISFLGSDVNDPYQSIDIALRG